VNTLNLSNENLETMRENWHQQCFACGENGIAIKHAVSSENYLETVFFCDDKFRGYKDKLHGGMISTLVDSAMTNCLFAAGIAAVTGELNVRFAKPVSIGKKIYIKTWITISNSPLFVLKSELRQDGFLKCRANAKFMKIKQPGEDL